MIISGNVPEDYSDITSGINALIASGVASGEIDEFYLYVDDSYYTGVFSAVIPNSGTFNLIGTNTYFAPQDTCYVNTEGDGSFRINAVNIIGEDTENWLFNISGALEFNGSPIISPLNGITTESGTLVMSNSYVAGSGAGIFFSGGTVHLDKVDVSNFSTGVYSSKSNIINSNLLDCTTSIDIPISGSTYIVDSLIHGGAYGIVKRDSTRIVINTSTIESVFPIWGSGGALNINSSILDGATRCINGFLESSLISYVTNVGLYPSGWLASDVVNVPSGTNISNSEPKFNDPSVGDYRLKFDYTNGSPYIEHTSKNIPSDVALRSEISNIVMSDKTGLVTDLQQQAFIYKQATSLLFSDYDKEVEFAYFIKTHPNLDYFTTTTASFSVTEQNLKSCLSKDGNHDHPYDWDIKTIDSIEILEDPTDLQYVISRSYLDILPIIDSKIGVIDGHFRFDKMNKSNIKVFNKEDINGITYDFDLSEPGTSIAWRINGRNQLLEKLDLFTGESLEVYPLLCPDLGEESVVEVEGLVYVGPRDNKFRFIKVTDPNTEFIGESQTGHFKWIDTTIDPQFDARGILAYKNNLYITGTTYSEDIYNRTSVPLQNGVGRVLRYYNSNKFNHYIAALASLSERQIALDENNSFPTDITIYEDGNILVSDYANYSELFRYKFAYDYAILNEQYNVLTRVLLRESYPSIKF